MTERVSVVVIGGGIAGLAAAYRLQQAGIDAVVLESGDRAGGRMQSVEVGGLMLEGGPDSLVARKPWAVDLCRELGIELVPTGASGVHLWTEHGLVPAIKDAPFGIPGDIGDVLRWPGLSSAGRRRALQDLLRGKRKDGAEESLGGLLRRRLGDEATDRAIAPVLAGLYAGDVDRLSARATFPELERWESSQGSLIRGSQAASRNARNAPTGPMFVKPRAGVAALPDALAGALGDRVRAGARATAITPASGGAYRVEIDGAEPVEAAHVVVAAPAPVAAELLSASAPASAADLAAIEYVSTSVVLLVYPEGTGDGLPEGTGFVVPRGMAPMTACSWINRKWPDASFGTRAVLRCFVGAAGEEEVIDAPDADIVAACASHLAAALPLPAEPASATVIRWPKSMPQYVVGHQDRVARIREGLPAGIVVVGNAYDGVGIPDSVHSGEQAAEQIAAALTSSAAPDKETV